MLRHSDDIWNQSDLMRADCFIRWAFRKLTKSTVLPPAVARLQQQRGSPSTRSYVGSVTTLSNLLRMLYSRAGEYPNKLSMLHAEAFSPNTPEAPECHGRAACTKLPSGPCAGLLVEYS